MRERSSSETRPQVALFITCLTDQFFPRVGVAVTKILERLGCDVQFPSLQTCCGQPIYNNGFHPEARELAARFVDIFSRYDYVVTPSGSCCAMVREQYHHLLEDDASRADSLKKVCESTFEFVEFLDKVLKVDLSKLTLKEPRKVTYHYTCHLRGLGIKDQASRLISQIGNVQFVPLERTEQCCGFGGTFAVKYPVISGAIVEDKTDCIAKTAADTLICNDAGCTMNISGMCHRRGIQTRVTHIAELMAEAMGIDSERW
jgi:L-lactate dehydrogenase complex protein LldE